VFEKTAFLKSEFELEFGTSVSYPVIDINSIGAGGGTVAWVDRGGMLHSGPQSAGAVPGPVCMQRGGTEPTVTDANVLLHRLNPRYLLGGEVPISDEAAREALARLGSRLGMGAEEMAQGILTLTVSNVVHAIRQHTIERGLDPREFVLMAYGGAGPLHAAEVAAELGIPAVLVPRYPGVTSALGLLQTDIRHDFVTTFLRLSGTVEPDDVAAAFSELERRGQRLLESEGVAPERRAFLYSADLRYLGQTHELTVSLPGPYSADVHARLGWIFRHAHLREYGHAPEGDEPVEMVNLRVASLGRFERPEFPRVRPGGGASPREERPVYFDGSWVPTPVYEREGLGSGDLVAGPAVVEQFDSTTLVPPGWVGRVDAIGNLILSRA
jgi:N-methylhydantoinase A